MSAQRINVGSVVKLRDKRGNINVYECTRIIRRSETLAAYEGITDPKQSKLWNVIVLKHEVDQYDAGDVVEVSEESIHFSALDPANGPFVIYNYFKIKKENKDVSESQESTGGGQPSETEGVSRGPEGGEGIRTENTNSPDQAKDNS